MSDTILKSTLYDTPVYVVKSDNPEYQRVYGAVRIPEAHAWAFPAFYPFSDMVAYDLEQLEAVTEWSELATAWREQEHARADLVQAKAVDPTFTYVTKPYAHQEEGLAFCVHNLRAALLMEPGLGKTKISIDTVRYIKNYENPDTKALVLVPAVILHKWGDEVRLHAGGQLRPIVIDGTPKKKKKLIDTEGDVYVATYGTASSDEIREYILEKIPYNVFIADESHNLQSHNSGKTESAVYLSRKAPRRIIMSGTAALGDPRHLWGQMNALAPFLNEKNYWHFMGRYVRFQDDQRRIVIGFKNLDVLNRRLKTVSVRKTKAEALDLPPRTFVTVNYHLHPEQRRAYNELIGVSLEELSDKLNIIEEATPAARLTKLLQITSSFMYRSNKDPHLCDKCLHMQHCVANKVRPYTKLCQIVKDAPAPTLIEFEKNSKLDTVKELLDTLMVDPTSKVVIWSKFHQELHDLERMLEKEVYAYVRVDGTISPSEMHERVRRFQTDPDCRVYIAQISTGVGIELTAANSAIYYSLSYDLGHWIQSQDRLLRIGQTRNVTNYTLISPGAVDDAVYELLQAKEDITAALTNPNYTGKNDFIRRIIRPEKI